MSSDNAKGPHPVLLALGAFLIAAVVGGVAAVAHQRPGAWTDLVPEGWLSPEDAKALKDPQAANREAYEKMSREAWQRSQAQQPGRGGRQGWGR
jgi:hypothetical protein